METILFIDKCVAITDGYKWKPYHGSRMLYCPGGGMFSEHDIMDGDPEWDEVHFPLLVQKAVEAVNRDSEVWRISMTNGCIYVHKAYTDEDPYGHWSLSIFDIEHAKIAALTHIFEQEGK